MRHLLSILLVLMASISVGHADSLSLDRQAWLDRVEDIDYSEEVEKKQKRKPNPDDFNVTSEDSSPPVDLDNIRTIVFAILILVALIVIALIIKNAKAPATIGKNRIEARTLEEAEENLPDVELNNILATALNDENWKIALRIQFLMLLQALIYADLIIWKKRKTNQQFVEEISDESIKRPFKIAVDAFDPAWYGTNQLNKDEFEAINQTIEQLKTRVNNAE